MPVQTRSQTRRIAIEGKPHDLDAFYSYQEDWTILNKPETINEMQKKKLKSFFHYLCKTQTNMPVQTRSQTRRIALEGEPHDLEAFNSYQEDWIQDYLAFEDRKSKEDAYWSAFR